MTFSARMIFRSFSADSGVWGGENRLFAPILILEKSVSGSEILPVPIEFPLDAKKWSDIRSYPFFDGARPTVLGNLWNSKRVD